MYRTLVKVSVYKSIPLLRRRTFRFQPTCRFRRNTYIPRCLIDIRCSLEYPVSKAVLNTFASILCLIAYLPSPWIKNCIKHAHVCRVNFGNLFSHNSPGFVTTMKFVLIQLASKYNFYIPCKRGMIATGRYEPRISRHFELQWIWH